MNKALSSAKLGEMPIPELLLTMSAPAVFSMLVQALYNIVDSVFVAHISEQALTALSFAFPMQMLVNAFSIGISIAASSLVGRKLGERNHNAAVKLAQNGLFLAFCLSIFWLFCGYALSKCTASMFAAKGGIIAEYTFSYLFICITFSFGAVFEMFFNKLMQSMGKMLVPMTTQIIGALTNIILDPLLIFGIGFFPAMGVKGAALATVLGQVAAMIFALSVFICTKHELKFSLRHFRPDKVCIMQIIKLGFPVIVANSISSCTTLLMNFILKALSQTAVAVLGVYFKLQSFVFMPVFGLNQGSLAIEAYNYGANNKERFLKTYKMCMAIALSFMTIGFILFQAIPEKLLAMFNADSNMLAIGIPALRLISLSFIPAALAVTTVNMFQSLGYGWKSMLLSILRQIGFLLPIAYIMSRTYGLSLVWIAFPLSEIATVLIFLPVAVNTVKKSFPEKKICTKKQKAPEACAGALA